MGRGDKKSKKGKRSKGSYGVSRNRTSIKNKLKRSSAKPASEAAAVEEAPVKPKRSVKKKSEA